MSDLRDWHSRQYPLTFDPKVIFVVSLRSRSCLGVHHVDSVNPVLDGSPLGLCHTQDLE